MVDDTSDQLIPADMPGPGSGPDSPVLDRVFSALADPIRRAILSRLDGQDLLVSELAEPFNVSLQAVSKHIQVLVKAGLVVQERTGRVSRCRLDAGPMYQAAVWINRYVKYWQAQFDTLALWLDEIEQANRQQEDARRIAIGVVQPTDVVKENLTNSAARSEVDDAVPGDLDSSQRIP